MKTVIINGSPRAEGDTAALLTVLKEELGGDIKQFNAYDHSILPCTDCRACRTQDHCAIDDAFGDLLSAIDDADVVVIASPVYFSTLTGPLLSVASRLQYVWISSAVRRQRVIASKPRKGIVLLTGGGQGKHEKALDTAVLLLKQMGAELVGSVCSLQTDRLPASSDAAAADSIRTIVKRL